MNCKTCGMILEDGATFCTECGAKVEVPVVAQPVVTEPVAVQPVATESMRKKFCPNCGAANEETAVCCSNCLNVFQTTSQQPTDVKKKGLQGNGKKIILGLAALAALVIVVIGGVTVAGKFFEKSPMVYLKNNEITSLKGKKPYTVSDDFYKESDDVEGPYMHDRFYVQVSENGKYLYYPKDMDGAQFDLCYKKLGSEKAEEKEIDSDVRRYTLLDNDDIIYTKVKNDKLILCYYNGKESKKIDSDIRSYYVSEDQKMVAWLSGDDEYDLYVSKIGSEVDEKIASDISTMYYVSEDFKQMIYFADEYETLCALYDMKEEEEIADDVDEAVICEKDEKIEVYYTIKEGEYELSYMDLIEDDLLESDSKMQEPDIEDYTHVETVQGIWGPYEEKTVDDKYYDDCDEYYRKQDRDYMREYYQEWIAYSADTYSLHRYVPEERTSEELVKDNVTYMKNSHGDALVYSMINEEDISKIDFSKIMEEGSSALEEYAMDYVDHIEKRNVAMGGKLYEIELENEDDVLYQIARVKDQCYVACQEDDGDQVLYTLELKDGIGTLSEITDEYHTGRVYEEHFYYVADVDYDDGEGTLYCDMEEIADNVVWDTVEFVSESGDILYLYDTKSDDDGKLEGTLCYYNSGKVTEIFDDVVYDGYIANDKGDVAFLVDYNMDKDEGDLYLYKNKNATKLDEDVAGILYF